MSGLCSLATNVLVFDIVIVMVKTKNDSPNGMQWGLTRQLNDLDYADDLKYYFNCTQSSWVEIQHYKIQSNADGNNNNNFHNNWLLTAVLKAQLYLVELYKVVQLVCNVFTHVRMWIVKNESYLGPKSSQIRDWEEFYGYPVSTELRTSCWNLPSRVQLRPTS